MVDKQKIAGIQRQVDAHKRAVAKAEQEKARLEQQKRADIARRVQLMKQQKARRSP